MRSFGNGCEFVSFVDMFLKYEQAIFGMDYTKPWTREHYYLFGPRNN